MSRKTVFFPVPAWEQASLSSSSLECDSPEVLSTHGNPTQSDKEPGALHEAVSEQQPPGLPLNPSKRDWIPPVIEAQCKCQRWMDNMKNPRPEGAWDQPTVHPSSPELFIPMRSGHLEKKRQPGTHCKVGLAPPLPRPPLPPPPPVVSGKALSGATSLGSSKNRKRDYQGPLHEPIWNIPLESSSSKPFLPVVMSLPVCQKGQKKEPGSINNLNQKPFGLVLLNQPSPGITAPESHKKRHHLGPLHEPIWEQPPLDSSLLVQNPVVAVPAVNFQREWEKDSQNEEQLPSTQPVTASNSQKGRRLRNHPWSPFTFCKLQ